MGRIFLVFGGIGVSHLPRKKPKNTTGPVGIFPEENNPIGSVVIEILRDGRTDIILLCIIDDYLF